VDSVTIGLDIGSSAVRAAEIEVNQGRSVLKHYGQVGLPHGAVTDGEIINTPVVSNALKRLWTHCGFSSNKVVLGVAGPRVIVRQADVPAMSAVDLRSSLKFDSQELIPIPMDDAAFDFSILEESPVGPDGRQTMRILMVAAHKDLLNGHLAALRGAGLSAVAMNPTSLALMRVVGGEHSNGVEVMVSIGSELTTVGVRENGVPRFIRSLSVGGAKLTETIANGMHLELAVAERLKRGHVPDDLPQIAQARKAMSVEMRDLADDIRATVDFFMSQAEETTINRLLITGGASQTEGLAAAVAGNLPCGIEQIDPFQALSVGDLELDADQLEQARASATTAIGLALWHCESPLIRLSVLPEEVAAARRARRFMTLAACGLAGLTAALGVVGADQALSVRSAQHQVTEAQQQEAALNAEVAQLTTATAVHGQVQSRAQLVITSLQGDLDWVRVIKQLAASMPTNLELTNFSATRATSPESTANASGSGTVSVVGTLTFSVTGSGGLPAVSSWLKGLQNDPDLTATGVAGISVTGNDGSVSFSSTSYLTTVSQSTRAQEIHNEFNN
jgi:type IV pilus assembly protein PilM